MIADLSATELLVWGVVVHVVVDWLFQNEWIALNKSDVTHPAGYVHAGVHTVALLLVFPWPAAIALGIAHFAIDTRYPLQQWAKVMTQTEEGPIAVAVHLWRDQTLHVAVIAVAALAVGAGPG